MLLTMHMHYESWVLSRLAEGPPCSIEPSMRCIPLRDDPICRECYVIDVEGTDADDDDDA